MERETLKRILSKDEKTNVTLTSADFLLLVEMYVEKKKQEEDEERYLTRDEASKFLSCDLSTLWRMEKKGVLVAHRLGKKPYYKKADLVRLMEKGGTR
jgi:excisionase family DNA binding protein